MILPLFKTYFCININISKIVWRFILFFYDIKIMHICVSCISISFMPRPLQVEDSELLNQRRISNICFEYNSLNTKYNNINVKYMRI